MIYWNWKVAVDNFREMVICGKWLFASTPIGLVGMCLVYRGQLIMGWTLIIAMILLWCWLIKKSDI